MDNENKIPDNLGSSKPTKTWFFERGDGFTFACDEQEAHSLVSARSNWARSDFKVIGTSDGTTYFNTIKNSRGRAEALLSEMNELKRTIRRYRETEDKMRFDELLDETDDKMQKVHQLIDSSEAILEDKKDELANLSKTIIQEAYDAEMEVARTNGYERPKNMDIITPVEGDREAILKKL